MELGFHRQRLGKGAKRGDLTGRNPTDRGKLGVKRHLMTDARGVPISVVLSAANTHDKWLVGAVLDAVPIMLEGTPIRPVNLCMDKGYDYEDTEFEVWVRGVIPHIRRRGEPALLGVAKGKPRRWVVERTNSWHNRFRGLLIRWERKASNYLAILSLACGLIAFQQAM